jgi:hypothetical protein
LKKSLSGAAFAIISQAVAAGRIVQIGDLAVILSEQMSADAQGECCVKIRPCR